MSVYKIYDIPAGEIYDIPAGELFTRCISKICDLLVCDMINYAEMCF